jgi:hypothetical protein
VSPVDFKTALSTRGWSHANVAWRWGITPAHLSRLIANPNRPHYWNDAANGLPRLCRSEAAKITRTRRDACKQKAITHSVTRIASSTDNGYSYQGFLVPGSVVSVVQAIGILADNQDEGVVVEVRDNGHGERYRIAFLGGEMWFDEGTFSKYLADIGKECDLNHVMLYLTDNDH